MTTTAKSSTHKKLATENSLEKLAQSINKKQGEIESNANSMISLACDIGAQLDEAKSEMKHGQWKSWVTENISFGHKQAAKYIRIYNNRDFLEKGPSEGFLTSIDAAVTFISSEKKRLESPEQVKTKASPAPVKTQDITPPEEGEECDLKEELEKEGRSMPVGISEDKSEDISPDISNDTTADVTPLFSKPQTRKTHIIDGDFTALNSVSTENAEGEQQKKHDAIESEPSGPIQESKSNPNKAEREEVADKWTADLVRIDIAACKYVPILGDTIGKNLMELAMRFDK